MALLPVAITFIPVACAVLGALVAMRAQISPAIESAIQHFAAGVVFAAAAAEVLPDLMHYKAPVSTLVGGVVGVAVMLLVMQLESRWKGPVGLLVATGLDLLVDGLVLGIAFAAGAKAGILLTVALTLEVVFLGLNVAQELRTAYGSPRRAVVVTGALMLAMPLGAMLGSPVATLSGPIVAGFLAFGLMALLYLVTEELLVEAHERPDRPWITSLFFAGFLSVLLLDQLIA